MRLFYCKTPPATTAITSHRNKISYIPREKKEMEKPQKKVNTEEDKKKDAGDALLLDQTDIWLSHILPFVGTGHYVFVAGT